MHLKRAQDAVSLAKVQVGSIVDQRLNVPRDVASKSSIGLISRLIRRKDSDECDDNDPCGRPLSANATTVTIVLGVV